MDGWMDEEKEERDERRGDGWKEAGGMEMKKRWRENGEEEEIYKQGDNRSKQFYLSSPPCIHCDRRCRAEAAKTVDFLQNTETLGVIISSSSRNHGRPKRLVHTRHLGGTGSCTAPINTAPLGLALPRSVERAAARKLIRFCGCCNWPAASQITRGIDQLANGVWPSGRLVG